MLPQRPICRTETELASHTLVALLDRNNCNAETPANHIRMKDVFDAASLLGSLAEEEEGSRSQLLGRRQTPAMDASRLFGGWLCMRAFVRIGLRDTLFCGEVL